jgi:hypothetical protein
MYSSTQFGSVSSMRLAPKAQYGPKPLGRFELADASARDINCPGMRGEKVKRT